MQEEVRETMISHFAITDLLEVHSRFRGLVHDARSSRPHGSALDGSAIFTFEAPTQWYYSEYCMPLD